MLFGALDDAYLFDIFDGKQSFEKCMKKSEGSSPIELTSLAPEQHQNIIVGLRWA